MKSTWNIFSAHSGMHVEVLNTLYLYSTGNIFVCFLFDLNAHLKKKKELTKSAFIKLVKMHKHKNKHLMPLFGSIQI